MKRIHVFNPASGCGHSPELLEKGAAAGEEKYITTGVGDCERFVYETCLSRPDTHFIIYGGDGTVNEAVNGILKAGAGDKAYFSVVPAGTGNDFLRTFTDKNVIHTIDVIKYNGRYAVNIVNFGFDSNVVKSTERFKKVFAGSPAYVAGVVENVFKKMGENWKITLTDENGNEDVFDETFTLALAANCRYYGGGFCSASLADPADGLIDFLAVRKVSVITFAKFVSEYKKGTHLDPETNAPVEKLKNYIYFRKVKKIVIEGIRNLCCDGEIEDTERVEMEIVPSAVRLIT